MRWFATIISVCLVYGAVYLVVRSQVKPAANMAYFVYADSATANRVCYYAFWPVYRIDRAITGRRHNADRSAGQTPEGA